MRQSYGQSHRYLGVNFDTTQYLEKVLTDRSSGVDMPAAVLLETIQGEGGINLASFSWLCSLEQVCRQHDILLIVDDIQVGCGRTGTFFSFEEAGISPDIITLSKSLSGFGLPLAMVLMKPELDRWKPGQHNGTFRGNNLAFITAKAALENYWQDDLFSDSLKPKSNFLRTRLEKIIYNNGGEELVSVRGRGMIQGIECKTGELASKILKKCFKNGMIIEACGSQDEVIKCLAPLTISQEELENGITILEESIREVLGNT
ncbi:aminotransferase class III-fold pyridoxal phosphate-dependent enzyme [Kamptonema sp. UHCC 0994]|uniref:aminotransferase class III-fold pyridoxal phosphate-dependent enzyme n=1 Tax=Kamptonema sp. UHCC 0994 TaxID=3031329 RepID=UPI0023B8EB1F|nr:aminotransferase class III-fold pyridoxal phosphate-dependent enzyme [Kamptonema sp. UHCC 0994]MDF0551651.1 aminotransferase class III-fold pyridoxal phosphate-dependent enzyme [Kamptonema sp. UHCC 0994]